MNAAVAERQDERFMRRALLLAERGRTAPNPHVGAVVVVDGRIVGEGFHHKAGTPHAEVHALAAAGAKARGATLYCTLEPCNHHGRTPPCTQAIVAAGIRRVIIGCRDPKDHGLARGAETLRAHGIEVEIGVLEEESQELIEDFVVANTLGRPLVELKAAITLDGKIATRTGDSKWITSVKARTRAHALRAYADAVLAGVGTVLADDPQLDVRLVEDRTPLRAVVDTHLRTPPSAALLATARVNPVVIFAGEGADIERRRAIEATGAAVIVVPLEDGRVSMPAVMRELHRRDVHRVLVEGGAEVHGSLLRAGLADRLALFIAPKILGDAGARSVIDLGVVPAMASAHTIARVKTSRIGDEILVRGVFVSSDVGSSTTTSSGDPSSGAASPDSSGS